MDDRSHHKRGYGSAYGWMRRTPARLRLVAMIIGLAAGLVGTTPASAAVLVSDTPLTSWRLNGETYAVQVVGDVTYVGGAFTQATAPNGTTRPRANLAAFDTHTGALTEGFRADTNAPVRALASDGTTLWVGGSFTSIGGANRSRVAAVDGATGAVRSFTANTNSHVYDLDLRAGRLFMVGSFGTVGSTTRQRAAAVNPVTGAVDAQWNPALNATAYAVRSNATGNVVYLGGNFTTVGGQARTGVAAVDGASGAATTLLFRDTYTGVLALDLNDSGTRLFGAVAGAGNQAAAWNTTTGTRVWRQRADGDVQAVVHHRDTVYFGFHESFDGNTTVRLLAADAATGTLDASFRPTWDRYWGVNALAASDDVLAAAGDFTRVSGVAAQGIALFPANQAPPPPPPETATYLTETSTWRYFDRGTEPGAGWLTAGFDDSAWASGLPQFGYGDGDETTVVSYGPDPNNKYITTYFRSSFDVPVRPTSATLSLAADDGAVVYINGVVVARDNMPAGTVTYTTLASANRAGAAENLLRSYPINPASLMTGTNTIAVEVHQDYRASSDLTFDLRLEGTLPQ